MSAASGHSPTSRADSRDIGRQRFTYMCVTSPLGALGALQKVANQHLQPRSRSRSRAGACTWSSGVWDERGHTGELTRSWHQLE
eukprot:807246-Prymnesium_polylepis.1